MKRLTALALTGALATTLTAFAVQDHGGNPASEEHGLLKRYEGTWDAEVEMAFMPGQKMKGSETNRMLGELWVLSDFESDFMGAPFQGHNVMGWDPEEEVYVSTWIESSTPTMSTSKGTFDAEKGVLEMTGKGVDMAGNKVDERTVTTFDGDDAIKFEMFQGDAHFMTITYKRRK